MITIGIYKKSYLSINAYIREMNMKQLSRTLQSVGKTCFVKFFSHFSSHAMSHIEIVEILKRETDYSEKSCISRTGHAQRIIKEGHAQEALRMVISSKSSRITSEIREEAQQLLNSLNK